MSPLTSLSCCHLPLFLITCCMCGLGTTYRCILDPSSEGVKNGQVLWHQVAVFFVFEEPAASFQLLTWTLLALNRKLLSWFLYVFYMWKKNSSFLNFYFPQLGSCFQISFFCCLGGGFVRLVDSSCPNVLVPELWGRGRGEVCECRFAVTSV